MIDLTNSLLLGLPIFCGKLGTIYQPKMRTLLTQNIEFNILFYPYTISKDVVLGDDEKFKTYKDFDLFFILNEDNSDFSLTVPLNSDETVPMLSCLIESLKLIYKTDKVELAYDEQEIIIDEKYHINKETFVHLSKIVNKMLGKEKMKREEKKHFTSKRQEELYKKIEKHREEHRKKNELLLGDMINALVHNPVVKFTYEEIREMTYFQLINSYTQMIGIDNHEQGMKYKTSDKFDMKEDLAHWSKSNKIQKVEVSI